MPIDCNGDSPKTVMSRTTAGTSTVLLDSCTLSRRHGRRLCSPPVPPRDPISTSPGSASDPSCHCSVRVCASQETHGVGVKARQ